MTSLHTRLFGLIAIIWGSVLVYFYHSLRVQKYLAPDFHTLILCGGIGILILGLYSLINPSEKEEESSCGHDHHHHDEHDHHDCAHGHHDHHDHEHHDDCADCLHEHDGHGPLVTFALTVLPLAAALYFTQDRLSEFGMSKRSEVGKDALASLVETPAFTLEDLEKRIPKNAEGEFELSLVTAAYVAGDREVEGIFEGLPVEFEGRLTTQKDHNESGLRRRIYRSVITCCAADLQVVGLAMEFDQPTPDPPNDSWVKASGTLTFETIGSDRLPLLKVRAIKTAEEPYSEFLLRN
ncbi:MAG: TIGR03943 family putative permease subunit [Verrucomicrobiaceae bacterium]